MGKFGLVELSYQDESAFAEVGNSFASGFRIPFLSVSPQLPSGRSSDGSIQTSSFEHRPGYRMSRSDGVLEFDVEMCGANVNTESGALPANHWLQKLWRDGLGGGNQAQVGGLVSGVPTTTSIPYSSGTPVLGGVLAFGQQLDGKGGGQLGMVSATGSPITLANALPAAPVAGDKYRACLLAYPTETLGATKRFLIGHADGGTQVARGCQLETGTIRFTKGQVPRASMRYRVGYWDQPTLSIPQVATIENCNAHIIGGGSDVVQTVGTSTRATVDAATVEISFGFQLADIPGHGVNDLQHIIGWERPADVVVTIAITSPFNEGTAQTEYDADGSDTTHKYYVGTCSTGDGTTAGEGRHFGVIIRRMFQIAERPAPVNYNGLNYMVRTYQARLGTDTTSDLTKAPFVLCWH